MPFEVVNWIVFDCLQKASSESKKQILARCVFNYEIDIKFNSRKHFHIDTLCQIIKILNNSL